MKAFRLNTFSLTEFERAIAELLEEGYSINQVGSVASSNSPVYRVLEKLRVERLYQGSLTQSGHATCLKTAHGRKMEPFIR